MSVPCTLRLDRRANNISHVGIAGQDHSGRLPERNPTRLIKSGTMHWIASASYSRLFAETLSVGLI
jgi:hypothetical protein